MITGFFGKIPATGDFVTLNLPRDFIGRWDRWMSMELRDRPDQGELDPRAWRFVVPDGVFSDQPCAGIWRMSEDRVGRRYPFAIVGIGATPSPDDAWFDAVGMVVEGAVVDHWSAASIASRLPLLPALGSAARIQTAKFWSDDWENHDFVFADIHDLAANALPLMRATREANVGG